MSSTTAAAAAPRGPRCAPARTRFGALCPTATKISITKIVHLINVKCVNKFLLRSEEKCDQLFVNFCAVIFSLAKNVSCPLKFKTLVAIFGFESFR
jgi:hypothetical protein